MDTPRKTHGGIRRFFSRFPMPQWLELSIIAIISLFFLAVGIAIVWAALVPIPSIQSFENREVAQSTKIYDRTGNVVLYDVHGAMRRTSVPLDQISPYVKEATVAIEDSSFYSHHGFRPLAFARALFANITTGSFGQGGSTITQQVVKNALLTQNKTVTRKLEEIILALRLERVYSKDQILSTYLNENPYGGTIYGVQEASQYYFGVDAKDLDLAQAAYIASLPQAPTFFSPYGSHRKALDARHQLVLTKMREGGVITAQEYEQAKAEPVQFKDEVDAGIKAPHFVFYIREYLEQKYGVEAVSNGGLRVITSLDYDLQQKAEDTVAKFGPNMLKSFNASNEGMVAIDPKTGQVIAMVGSRGYFDKTIDGMVNVATQPRQPGSSFKPFVYATAFEKGYTPETVVFDLKTQFSTACAPSNLSDEPPCYSPVNFDGKFKGPMTFRNALAQSENIPAVKALYLAGIQDSIKTAQDLGITTLSTAARYGLTLVLGGGEVNLTEMTGAYSVFANDGVKNPITGILRVEDNRGNVLEQYQDKSVRVLDPQITRQISDVLSDNVARTPEFGADSPLNFPGYDVADKTGTTNDFRDVWIIGYTPGISVGAWAGNNNNSQMVKKIAAFIIAPMWHEFMLYALEKYPSDSFTPPAPDPDLDTLPPVLRGQWENPGNAHDILYWVKKDAPRTGAPTNPWKDSQAALWDYPVQIWAGEQVASSSGDGSATGDGSTPVSSSFQIVTPQQGTVIPANVPLTISASHPNPETVLSVMYFLNGAVVGTATAPPYSVSAVPTSFGPTTLKAVVTTTSGTEEHSISFIVQ